MTLTTATERTIDAVDAGAGLLRAALPAGRRGALAQELGLDYRPIDNEMMTAWGPGDYIRAELNPLERRIWDLAYPDQGKRDDPPHAECVAYITLELCRLRRLDERERTIAVTAAICHDTGYASMPDIAYRFDAALHNKSERGKRILYLQRIAHEKFGVARTKGYFEQAIRDQPRAEDWLRSCCREACRIIERHDSRGYADRSEIPPLAAFVWDADRIYRVLVPECRVRYEGKNRKSLADLFVKLDTCAAPDNYLLRESLAIARLELANTMLTIHEERARAGAREELPQSFLRAYAGEISCLRRGLR